MQRTHSQIHLTPRQQQVLTMVSQGQTSKEIGRRLKISPRTIEVYRAQLNRKFGVSNLANLIQAAVEQGLVRY